MWCERVLTLVSGSAVWCERVLTLVSGSAVCCERVLTLVSGSLLQLNDCHRGVVFDGLETLFAQNQYLACKCILKALNNRKYLYMVTLKHDFYLLKERERQAEEAKGERERQAEETKGERERQGEESELR